MSFFSSKVIVITLLLIAFIVPMSHAWFNNDASSRTNFTAENIAGGTLTNFPFLIKQNISGFADSCIDMQVSNGTDNGLLKYHIENNTCNVDGLSFIWAKAETLVTNTNTTFGLYHNFITPFLLFHTSLIHAGLRVMFEILGSSIMPEKFPMPEIPDPT